MLTVHENGVPLNISYADLMKYHGPGFPGGVAHAYCAMQQAVAALAATSRGTTLARYVWEFGYRGRTVRVQLRDAGFVTDEFIALGAKTGRTSEDEARLTVLEQEMAERLLTAAVGEVYEVVATTP